MEQILNTVYATVQLIFSLFLATLFGVLTAIVAFIVYKKYQFRQLLKKQIEEGGNNIVLLIRIQSQTEGLEEAVEKFLRALHRVLPNNTLISFEMVSQDQFLGFYIVLPKQFKTLIESQLYAQFADAEVEEVEDYLKYAFDEENTAIAEVKFKRASVTRIKTHDQLEESLIKNISSFLAKTETKEKVYMQLNLKRLGTKLHHRGLYVFYLRLFGRKASFAKLLDENLYQGRLRIAYISDNPITSRTNLSVLANFFKSLKGENELKVKVKKSNEEWYRLFKTRLFEKGDLWNVREIATVYHFPDKSEVAGNIMHTTSKRAPAPDILPRQGLVDPKDVSFIGETNYRNDRVAFGIKRIDRRRHVYIVGKTGSGKSKLLELLLIADILNNHGLCLVDPHGDLCEQVLKYVPKQRIKDVVYVNPSDRDYPIGFNPLERIEDYEQRLHLSRFFISIFKKMFADTWNSRMEHLMRYITLALLETDDSSIMGIPRMLSDTAFRLHIVKQVQDPVVKSFWTNEFSTSNEQFMDIAAVPIMNKIGQFITNPVIRNMVGQRKNMLDFRKFMDEGKIVIVNASKGKIGEDNAGLLGSMIITKIQQAALSRARLLEEERRDFYLYVDEFQNFATDAFSIVLSEARKYRLDLTIAHQYIAQLPEDVKATALGNVGTIISFAIGGDDAAYLAKEFTPTFTADDMINLNAREMYIKMSIDGKITPPFSAKTLSVPKAPYDHSQEVIEYSRRTYGRNRIEVEAEIENWSKAKENVGAMVSSGSSQGGAGGSGNAGDDGSFPEPII